MKGYHESDVEEISFFTLRHREKKPSGDESTRRRLLFVVVLRRGGRWAGRLVDFLGRAVPAGGGGVELGSPRQAGRGLSMGRGRDGRSGRHGSCGGRRSGCIFWEGCIFWGEGPVVRLRAVM